MTAACNETFTENGMKAYNSSLNAIVDLFFEFGGNRGNSNAVLSLFQAAVAEDLDLAVRVALYGRDVRGGMGEREHFRTILTYFARSNPTDAVKLIPLVPSVGRFDDLFAFIDTPVESNALDFYTHALREGNGLAAKWCPREKSSQRRIASKLRRHIGLSPRDFRKLLVSATNVVESKMCSNEWTDIDYSKVPSLSMIRNIQAFVRHDPYGIEEFKKGLDNGTTKVNAGAVYPHQVVRSIFTNDERVSEHQWKALPNWIPEGKSFIPVVDTSGSMMCACDDAGTSAIDVSVGLGLYCAMKAKGEFQNKMLTFNSKPSWIDVSGLSLNNAVRKTANANWGMTTNIELTYNLILQAAVNNAVPQSDMPDYLIIFSDMQFDAATSGANKIIPNMRERFEQAGYEMPKVVFWNLRGKTTNETVPVTYDEHGTALVSGFSPALLKSVLSDSLDDFTPFNVVLEAVSDNKYNWLNT